MARFSLKWLFVVTALIGLVVAAMRNASDQLAAFVILVLWTSVFVAIVLACAGRKKAFCSAYVGTVIAYVLMMNFMNPNPSLIYWDAFSTYVHSHFGGPNGPFRAMFNAIIAGSVGLLGGSISSQVANEAPK